MQGLGAHFTNRGAIGSGPSPVACATVVQSPSNRDCFKGCNRRLSVVTSVGQTCVKPQVTVTARASTPDIDSLLAEFEADNPTVCDQVPSHLCSTTAQSPSANVASNCSHPSFQAARYLLQATVPGRATQQQSALAVASSLPKRAPQPLQRCLPRHVGPVVSAASAAVSTFTSTTVVARREVNDVPTAEQQCTSAIASCPQLGGRSSAVEQEGVLTRSLPSKTPCLLVATHVSTVQVL